MFLGLTGTLVVQSQLPLALCKGCLFLLELQLQCTHFVFGCFYNFTRILGYLWTKATLNGGARRRTHLNRCLVHPNTM